MKPKIIVLCGSSQFCDIMAICAWLLERDENAITMGLHLLPRWYSTEQIPDHLAEHEGVASAMDELHLRKIDLADEIFIVNHNDYIGDSTQREVEYAMKIGKPIRWYQQEIKYRNDVETRIRRFIESCLSLDKIKEEESRKTLTTDSGQAGMTGEKK